MYLNMNISSNISKRTLSSKCMINRYTLELHIQSIDYSDTDRRVCREFVGLFVIIIINGLAF